MFSESDLLFLPTDADGLVVPIGAYAQKIVIVLSASDFATAQPFLEKMLGAAQKNLLNDTLVLQIADAPRVNITQHLRTRQPDQVFVFGLSPAQICLNIEAVKYQPLFFQNIRFLFADSLVVLEPNKDLKSKLWTAMKALFKLA
jgi:hypothetical protein